MLEALALHGTIISRASGQRCMYVPYLDLSADGKMTLGGVAYVCPSEKGGTTDQGAVPSGGANQGATPQK